MCNQCELLRINGIVCHETGCPNAWRNPVTDEPKPVACFNCGCDFTPNERGERYCSACCAASAYGAHCDCDTCAEFAREELEREALEIEIDCADGRD